MTKAKNKPAALKPPKPAAAKPGMLKTKAAAGGIPTKRCPVSQGKENAQQGGQQKRGRLQEEPAGVTDTSELGKRKRNQPTRFASFEEPESSLGSPQSGTWEPAGAAEAQQAAALSQMADVVLGDYLHEDVDNVDITAKFGPLVEKMHRDRAEYHKEKADRMEKAKRNAENFIPADQKEVPSPVLECPEVERQRALRQLKRARKSVLRAESPSEEHRASPQQLQPDDMATLSFRELQAAKDEADDLRSKMVLKDSSLAHLQNKNQQLKDQLKDQKEEFEFEIKRLKAELLEAQSVGKKAGKTKKEQKRRSAEFRELNKEVEEMSRKLDTYASCMDSMKIRLKELEAT